MVELQQQITTLQTEMVRLNVRMDEVEENIHDSAVVFDEFETMLMQQGVQLGCVGGEGGGDGEGVGPGDGGLGPLEGDEGRIMNRMLELVDTLEKQYV